MRTVKSKDGTIIAYDRLGQGPALILVGGALEQRAMHSQTPEYTAQLGQYFTVFDYDRRGRGDSTDTQPYAVEREIEDIETLVAEAGGSAFLLGNSSGAALALEAAIELGDRIKGLAMYEAPYNSDEAGRQGWKAYTKRLNELVAAGRRADALVHFMMLTGMPEEQVPAARQHPMWPLWEGAALSLAYDAAVLGEESAVPTERAARVSVPTLIMNGGASYPFMRVAAGELAQAIPNAQHRILEGQTHEVAPDVLASVLHDFFILDGATKR
jgi:pimeloyl-ACP methyl ester carboxylesterase